MVQVYYPNDQIRNLQRNSHNAKKKLHNAKSPQSVYVVLKRKYSVICCFNFGLYSFYFYAYFGSYFDIGYRGE